MDPNKTKKVGGPREAALAAVACVLIIAAIATVVYVFWKNPDLVNSLVNLILVAVVVIVLLAVAFVIVSIVIGIGYFAKGTTVQTDMSYDLDSVTPVEGAMVGKDKKERSYRKTRYGGAPPRRPTVIYLPRFGAS